MIQLFKEVKQGDYGSSLNTKSTVNTFLSSVKLQGPSAGDPIGGSCMSAWKFNCRRKVFQQVFYACTISKQSDWNIISIPVQMNKTLTTNIGTEHKATQVTLQQGFYCNMICASFHTILIIMEFHISNTVIRQSVVKINTSLL